MKLSVRRLVAPGSLGIVTILASSVALAAGPGTSTNAGSAANPSGSSDQSGASGQPGAAGQGQATGEQGAAGQGAAGQGQAGASQSGGRGLVRLVDDAAADVPSIQPLQRSSISLATSGMAIQEAQLRAAQKGLVLAIADQMDRTGQIDCDALQPQIQEVVFAREGLATAAHLAFQSLHASLSHDQRIAFADALEKRIAARSSAFDSGAWLDQWSSQIGLDASQRQKIRAGLAGLQTDFEQAHGRGKQVLEAFKCDDYAMDMPSMFQVANDAQQSTVNLVNVTAAAMKVLSPEQRARAVALLRQSMQGGQQGVACAQPAGGAQPGAPQGQPATGTEGQGATAEQRGQQPGAPQGQPGASSQAQPGGESQPGAPQGQPGASSQAQPGNAGATATGPEQQAAPQGPGAQAGAEPAAASPCAASQGLSYGMGVGSMMSGMGMGAMGSMGCSMPCGGAQQGEQPAGAPAGSAAPTGAGNAGPENVGTAQGQLIVASPYGRGYSYNSPYGRGYDVNYVGPGGGYAYGGPYGYSVGYGSGYAYSANWATDASYANGWGLLW
jgi:hypothetical protein